MLLAMFSLQHELDLSTNPSCHFDAAKDMSNVSRCKENAVC